MFRFLEKRRANLYIKRRDCYERTLALRECASPAILLDRFLEGGDPDELRDFLSRFGDRPDAQDVAALALKSWTLFRQWDFNDRERLASFLSCYANALRAEGDISGVAARLAGRAKEIDPAFLDRMFAFIYARYKGR